MDTVTQRQRRHFANAEAVGTVRNRTSGYAGTTSVTKLDLDIAGTRMQVSFLGARAQDAAAVALGATIHVLGRLAQWGSNGKRVGIDIAGPRHSWAIVEGTPPRAGWSLVGVLEGISTSPEMPDAVTAAVTVVIPAAERDGRQYDERRRTYEVVAKSELAGRLRGLPEGTIADLAGTLDSVPASDGYGRQTWRSTLLVTQIRGKDAFAAPAAVASAPAVMTPPAAQPAAPAQTAPQPAAPQPAAARQPARGTLPW